MAQLIVRNLPEEVKEGLKRRAKGHGRSLEAEVRSVLERAASTTDEISAPKEGFGKQIAREMAEYEVSNEEWQEFERILAENRKMWRSRPVDFGE